MKEVFNKIRSYTLMKKCLGLFTYRMTCCLSQILYQRMLKRLTNWKMKVC